MKKMTKEQLAGLLEGRSYCEEITEEQEYIAKENNLLVLFVSSNDLLEAKGAVENKYKAYEGCDFLLVKNGEIYFDEGEKAFHMAGADRLYYASYDYAHDDNPRLIRVEWWPKDNQSLSWRISSNMPYASFTIVDRGDPYCEGIVIDLTSSEITRNSSPAHVA